MNQTATIYQDMAARTGGSIYVGVVGPVRTGKSTFIKRFRTHDHDGGTEIRAGRTG